MFKLKVTRLLANKDNQGISVENSMKKLKTKKVRQKKSKKSKGNSSIDLKSIQKSFTSLDPQNIGSWPVIVKITLVLFIFLLVGIITASFPVKEKLSEIETAEEEQNKLIKEYEEKYAKAQGLEAYTKQIKDMEASFKQLLEQLPKETKIPGLVEDINMRGVRSDIQFQDIYVNNEVEQELFIEQPIKIQAKGEYHKFANFVSSIAGLPRIITTHDFTIKNNKADDYNSLPELSFTIDANTYRAKDK